MTAARPWLPYAAGILTGGAALVVVWIALHHDPASTTPPYHETRAEDDLRRLANDPAVVTRGRQLFQRNCTLCHGTTGQGVTGPNLRDDHWLKGSEVRQLCESIANGNPAKGMAAWRAVLSPDDLVALAGFIGTLQGGDAGGGRAAEGVHAPITWRGTP